MENYYCQKKSGAIDFSIDDWNDAYNYCVENESSEVEMSKILEGSKCKSQCFDCMAVVGDRQERTKTKIALNWWNKLTFEDKFYQTISWLKTQNKDTTSKHPNYLTSSEIKQIHLQKIIIT